MSKKNTITIVGIVVILATIGFLIYIVVSTRNYAETTAKVISVEFDPTATPDADETTVKDYKVTLEYTVDEKVYTLEINAYQKDYSVGEEVKLWYDPNKPNNTALGRMSIPVLIGICAAALVVGTVVIIKARRG